MRASATESSRWRSPFAGLLIAGLLLGAVEACLHSDWFLYRYRSVFAAGRAMDKLLALENRPVPVVALGNSRVDNGFHPQVFEAQTGLQAFNLGLPGAEACNIEGVVTRLAQKGSFGKGRIEQVLFGLDEGFFQRTGGLGYEVFFDRPSRLLGHGRYVDWLRARIRLWGYTDSLRTLQEPAKLIRFAQASISDIPSWGGNARDTAGFRAADEVTNQTAEQAMAQARVRHPVPDAELLECFRASIELLQAAGTKVSVFLTPSLRSTNPFAHGATASGDPHYQLKQELETRGVSVLEFDVTELIDGAYFANPGHLNREGARRFTMALATALDRAMPRGSTN